MASKLFRFGGLVVALLLAAAVYGEGARRPFSLKLTHLLELRALGDSADTLSSPDCSADEAGWARWRDDKAIVYLLRVVESKDIHADGPHAGAFQRVPHLDRDAVMDRATKIADALDECHGLPPASVVRNLRDFVNTLRSASYAPTKDGERSVHQFGHGPDFTDKDYLDKARAALQLPSLLRCAAFLQAISAEATYAKAGEIVKAHNAGQAVLGCTDDSELSDGPWTQLVYRSQFLGVPDASLTRGRFFILVPGKLYDRWIQFGILTEDDRNEGHLGLIRNVSVVAHAKKADMGGGPHFDALADWYRCQGTDCIAGALQDEAPSSPGVPATFPAASGPIDLKFRRDLTLETDDCQLCHKSGPLGIHPEKVYDFEAGTGRLVPVAAEAASAAAKALNDRIAGYRRPPVFQLVAGPGDALAAPAMYGGIGLGADPADYGLGQRSTAAIRACSAAHRLDDTSVARVRDSMNCSHCHNGGNTGTGLINFPLATEKRPSELIFVEEWPEVHNPNLVASRLLGGAMPIDHHSPDGAPKRLTPAERAALYDCLSTEYFDPGDPDHPKGLFVDWLRNQDGYDERYQPPTLVAEQESPSALAAAAASVPGQAPAAWAFMKPLRQPRADGAAQFGRLCSDCHSLSPGGNGIGPSLAALLRRPVGADPSFGQYSAAFRSISGKTDPATRKPLAWNEKTLSAFLADPDAFVADQGGAGRPDMRMRLPGRDRDQRAMREAIVAYLMTLK
jgi:cytochrome c